MAAATIKVSRSRPAKLPNVALKGAAQSEPHGGPLCIVAQHRPNPCSIVLRDGDVVMAEQSSCRWRSGNERHGVASIALATTPQVANL